MVVANQPRIEAKGWIDASHLPIIFFTSRPFPRLDPTRPSNYELRTNPTQNEPLFAVRVAYPTKRLTLTQAAWNIFPNLYDVMRRVFSEEAAQRFHQNCASGITQLTLKPGAPNALPGKIYSLTAQEARRLKKFVIEHTPKRLHPSLPKAPTPLPSSSSRRRMEKLRPVKTTRRLLNQWTVSKHVSTPANPPNL